MQEGIPLWFMTSYSGQLSLLPSVGWKLSTGQSVVMLCGYGELRQEKAKFDYTIWSQTGPRLVADLLARASSLLA